jgi:protein SCO1
VNRPSLPRRSGPPRSGTCQARLWVAAVALRLLVGAPAPALAQLASLPRLGPAPNFALTTQQHDRLWLTQLRERIVVLTFFCTTCEVCPDLLPALLDLSRGLGAAASHRVFFVAVSVDPARDTAPVLRRFAQVQGVDLGAWIFLTGRPAEVDAVARWYGAEVSRDGGRLRHACRVTLIDGAGIVRARLGSDQLRHLPGTLTSLLAEPRGS